MLRTAAARAFVPVTAAVSAAAVPRVVVAAPAVAARSVPAAARAASSGGVRYRPMSPHLPISRFAINMTRWVLCGGAGIALRGGVTLGGTASLPASAGSFEALVYQLQQYPLVAALARGAVVAPLVFHYLGGIRHLVRA